MSLQDVLSKLSKVRGRKDAWTACCPAHEDKSPSLAIKQLEDGCILLHCFGGCSVHDVLGSIGMDMADLFPDVGDNKQRVKPAFYANDLLRVIGFETRVVAITANDMANGRKPTEKDLQRMRTASERIQEAMRYANV